MIMKREKTVSIDQLTGFIPKHCFFVGVDSDGCIFDTMEAKQKKCFHPAIISYWKLHDISKAVRETAEFVNLYSSHRGQNRFTALARTWKLLQQHPEVRKKHFKLPDISDLFSYIKKNLPLSNEGLGREIEKHKSGQLRDILEWSTIVNRLIRRKVRKIKPFNWALKSLVLMQKDSDVIYVSQTPSEALFKEWRENKIYKYVSLIAGQELGTKADHIALSTKGRYTPDHILMIGDAPGDKKAAKKNNACFYPINPGKEEASWKRFFLEAYDLFLQGRYRGHYEKMVVNEFESLLPAKASWQK